MRWDPSAPSRQTLEWDGVVQRPSGKHMMQSYETPGKNDTMGAVLRGQGKADQDIQRPHIYCPESADMYAVMAAQSPQQPGPQASPVIIKRKRVFNHVPGEEHTPIYEERFAWLVKPKPKVPEGADEQQTKAITMMGPTHPIGVQRDKPWH